MKKILKSSIALLSILVIYSAYITSISAAVQNDEPPAPTNLSILESTSNSVHLDWSDVTGVTGYYLYYGTRSGSEGIYDEVGVDIIDESEFILDNLASDTTYYFAVTSVDKQFTESDFSNEVSYTLGNSSSTSNSDQNSQNFKIQEVEVIDETSLRFRFSKALDDSEGTIRDFILENKNTKEELTILATQLDELDNSMLLVVLDSNLESETQYELTVLDIQGENGESIALGIDAFQSFQTPDFSTPIAIEEVVEDLNSASPDDIELEDPDAQDMPEEQQEPLPTNIADVSAQSGLGNAQGNNAGQNIQIQELESNTLNAASEIEKLPQTGPEHWMLAFIALALGAGVFFTLKGRKS